MVVVTVILFILNPTLALITVLHRRARDDDRDDLVPHRI